MNPRVYVVDTDVISETTKPAPDTAVLAWLAGAEVSISAITVSELSRGIERVHPGKKRQFLDAWFARLLDATVEVLSFDADAALAAAQLDSDARRRGRAIDTRDLFILAIAKARGLPLATGNYKHFHGHGIEVFDPFTGSVGR